MCLAPCITCCYCTYMNNMDKMLTMHMYVQTQRKRKVKSLLENSAHYSFQCPITIPFLRWFQAVHKLLVLLVILQ